ncbi:hypothetical protein G3435_18335 [Pseudomonas sp. MAFF212428]|uniref:LysR substrate-binding domain-containing protein n=1 Tax=Pseudomonas brassicae TaxID=2708063 RepID=A0A6M0CV42_9PSED|nr:hypothetical protein [Pseudomonas brassicae]
MCRPDLALPAQGLAGQRLLHSATRPEAWQQWLRLSGQSAEGSPRADYEHFYLCIQAALAGLGVALASRLMVQDELASGQLCAPPWLHRGRLGLLPAQHPPLRARRARHAVRRLGNRCQRCTETDPTH